MLWSHFILILTLGLVSARPSPELSLEEIEKELEQLTAKENDTPDATKSKSDEATSTKEDSAKETKLEVPKELADQTREVPKTKLETVEKKVPKELADQTREVPKTKLETVEKKVPKELADQTREVPKTKLETVEKTVTDTEQKKDATTETKVDAGSKKTTDSKVDFKDTSAYRRLMESETARGFQANSEPHLPEVPQRRTYDYMKYDSLPSLRRPYHPEIPARRTYDLPEVPKRRPFDFTYRKSYDLPPLEDYNENRRKFSPNSDPVEILRRLSSMHHSDSEENQGGFVRNDDPMETFRELHAAPGMTKTERTAISSGKWIPGSAPVQVPGKMPPPISPDTAVRSYNNVHNQLNDKETEDLIHGKYALTDMEKRRRYLMDQLAERIKSKVDEAQKRGLKVPDKIIDFLWNYETRRALDLKADKTHFSH